MRKITDWFLLAAAALILLSGCGLSGETSEGLNESQGEFSSSAEDFPPAVPEAESSVFQIVPGETTARFEILEDLRSAMSGWGLGAVLTVVGTTDQVAGELVLNPVDLSATELGEIRIDARGFSTDQGLRNIAIQRQILQTDEYPFILFKPQRLDGLAAQAEIGETVTFDIVGDLTIREITLEKTFTVSATLASETQVVGTGSARVTREEFDLTVPAVPNVTFLADEVMLFIDFVARKP